MSTQSNLPPVSVAENALETENYVETYKVIAEWIRFADAKAGATLTVNGILMGLLVPTLKAYFTEKTEHPASWWAILVVTLFLVWLSLLAASAVMAFLCVLPIRGKLRQLALRHTQHFHPAAISQHYPITDIERFVKDCEAMGQNGVKREIISAILIDSHLSASKYGHVTRAVRLLGGSIVFGFLYLLAVQF